MLAFIAISGTEVLKPLEFPVIREERQWCHLKVPFNHS